MIKDTCRGTKAVIKSINIWQMVKAVTGLVVQTEAPNNFHSISIVNVTTRG